MNFRISFNLREGLYDKPLFDTSYHAQFLLNCAQILRFDLNGVLKR